MKKGAGEKKVIWPTEAVGSFFTKRRFLSLFEYHWEEL